MIDPEQIHQVAVNLLLNSLDALPRGGTVSIELSQSGWTANSTEGHGTNGAAVCGGVVVHVRDTGPGIAANIRERLFEPFVSSKETGVGLGLSISKRLIEEHGGTIRGDNLAEGGALFSFQLPYSVPAVVHAST
jgi:signal transduction histidine kinase